MEKGKYIFLFILLLGIKISHVNACATANYTVNNTTPVVGQTITFTDASTGAASWAWTFGSAATPSTANTIGPHIVSYSSEGQYTTSLTVTGQYWGNSTHSVIINVGFTPTAGSIGSDQYVCSGGDPAQINNVDVGTGSGTITYRWEYSESPFTMWTIVTGAGSSYDPPSGLTATRRYRRTTISTFYGVERVSSPTAIVTATVEAAPTAPTTASSDRSGFCYDDVGNISLSVSGGTGRILRWYTGSCGGTAIGTGNPLVIPSPTTTTTYYASWENSCGSSSCASTTVTVYNINAFVSRVGDEYICPGFVSPPFNPESGINYNIGATQVEFSIARQNSTANWSFDWEVDETDIEVNSYSPNLATGTYSGSGSPVNLIFYITNVANTQQTVTFSVSNVEDTNHSCSEGNTSDNVGILYIMPMPEVGSFE